MNKLYKILNKFIVPDSTHNLTIVLSIRVSLRLNITQVIPSKQGAFQLAHPTDYIINCRFFYHFHRWKQHTKYPFDQLHKKILQHSPCHLPSLQTAYARLLVIALRYH